MALNLPSAHRDLKDGKCQRREPAGRTSFLKKRSKKLLSIAPRVEASQGRAVLPETGKRERLWSLRQCP
jgi:hypothetical protein